MKGWDLLLCTVAPKQHIHHQQTSPLLSWCAKLMNHQRKFHYVHFILIKQSCMLFFCVSPFPDSQDKWGCQNDIFLSPPTPHFCVPLWGGCRASKKLDQGGFFPCGKSQVKLLAQLGGFRTMLKTFKMLVRFSSAKFFLRGGIIDHFNHQLIKRNTLRH